MRRSRKLFGSLILVCVGTFGDEATAAPPAPACAKNPAEQAFSTGMEEYSYRHFREAIPGLTDAARHCPKPREAWPVYVKDFGQYPFLPFYFLGKSYYGIKDRPSALRNLYLSACFGEPSRDDDFQENLVALTRQCREELASPRRPEKHADFADGFAALGQERWQQAAEKMWSALLVWEEDGGTTFSAGRWPDIYLPRYQLAEALFKLGCEREACEQLDRSLLGKMTGKRVEAESQRLAELAPACAQKRRGPYSNSPICERWRCWLQQKGSTR